ncbi:binuclear zinc transcription factor [Apiospora aurea]|uniref:Binuclear zinc transcription factor n=1 Tax=Apiospora aurea TaxID=335848 RepID=A0ABR1PV25_9PEZI
MPPPIVVGDDTPDCHEQTTEALACVTCRARKLKCNRVKPACSRCARVKGECVYPESRRKPAFKRRNVKELEARLAQVEILLRDVGTEKTSSPEKAEKEKPDEAAVEFGFPKASQSQSDDVFFQGMDYNIPPASTSGDASNMYSFNFSAEPSGDFGTASDFFGGELLGLGISEPTPLSRSWKSCNHQTFFQRQSETIPILNQQRYLQEFYSPPHMKPPMCLQYAIWAIAAIENNKYSASRDVFYQRARQYAEADEMKGHGEHFLTVRHAQAWACIAVCEAKTMMFTRAAMSIARAVRLAEMMGLQRLDCGPGEMPPAILPPRDWIDLEERRRTFWGIFCLDSHCSISTGWPTFVDPSEVTTHLPCSEAAFRNGEEAESCTLNEALKGYPYSSFASSVVICHFFNEILKHVHRPRPDDFPENYEFGRYWTRHRDLDSTLSSAFMFLPEGFRLPDNYCDRTAVHTNLNLHASIICLHHAAIDKVDKHKLPNHLKKASHTRLLTAAQEIVNIMKTINTTKSHPVGAPLAEFRWFPPWLQPLTLLIQKTPLAALSLYSAASVYIYHCKETGVSGAVDNLSYIVSTMSELSQDHYITRAFLKQVAADIECNNLESYVKIPKLGNLPSHFANGDCHVPLLVRSSVSRHHGTPPVPGQIPPRKPAAGMMGKSPGLSGDCGVACLNGGVRDAVREIVQSIPGDHSSHKRKRQAPVRSPTEGTSDLDDGSPLWAQSGSLGYPESFSSNSTPPDSNMNSAVTESCRPQDLNLEAPSLQGNGPNSCTQSLFPMPSLPHRTNSPSMAGPMQTTPSSSGANSGGITLGPTVIGSRRMPSTLNTTGPEHGPTLPGGVSTWEMAGHCMYSQFQNGVAPGASTTDVGSWNFLGMTDQIDWGTGTGVAADTANAAD